MSLYVKETFGDRKIFIVNNFNSIYDIIIDNKAGSKGEWLIWSDILELYKNE